MGVKASGRSEGIIFDGDYATSSVKLDTCCKLAPAGDEVIHRAQMRRPTA